MCDILYHIDISCHRFGIGDIESSRMERGLEQNKSVLREVRTTSINEIGILPTGSVLRTVFEMQSLKSFQSEKTVDLWILVYHFCLPYPGSFVIPEMVGEDRHTGACISMVSKA